MTMRWLELELARHTLPNDFPRVPVDGTPFGGVRDTGKNLRRNLERAAELNPRDPPTKTRRLQ